MDDHEGVRHLRGLLPSVIRKLRGKLIKFIRKCMKEMREREINNGRFAMFAAIGIIVAELYTGKDAIEQFGL